MELLATADGGRKDGQMEKKEIARNVFIIDAGLASGAGACGGGGGDSQGSGKYCFFKKGWKKGEGGKGENLEETNARE